MYNLSHTFPESKLKWHGGFYISLINCMVLTVTRISVLIGKYRDQIFNSEIFQQIWKSQEISWRNTAYYYLLWLSEKNIPTLPTSRESEVLLSPSHQKKQHESVNPTSQPCHLFMKLTNNVKTMISGTVLREGTIKKKKHCLAIIRNTLWLWVTWLSLRTHFRYSLYSSLWLLSD